MNEVSRRFLSRVCPTWTGHPLEETGRLASMPTVYKAFRPRQWGSCGQFPFNVQMPCDDLGYVHVAWHGNKFHSCPADLSR